MGVVVEISLCHDDVIKWKHFPRHWPFVRGIHRFPMNSPHKGQWRGALMFTLICGRINGWVNNREAGDLRRYRAHSDVIVMVKDRDPFSLPIQNHSYWWPGSARGQGISSHDVEIVLLESAGFTTWMVSYNLVNCYAGNMKYVFAFL